eukprot:6490672-Amphidinium_carterae.1
MSQCTAGVIYARRDAYQLRSAYGVALVGRKSCMPSVTAIGRTKPECLSCDDVKMKPKPRGGKGGDPPNPPDDDGYGGGGWYGGKGRRHEEREKKPTKEDLIFKIASKALPKLEVKNPHKMNGIALKRQWDFWLKQAMPKHTMERTEAYCLTAVPDILFMLTKKIFPNEDNLRLAMSKEVNRLPFDKSTISFYKASTILEDWIQKVKVARKYKAHIEPQKMLVVVTKITEAVRNADGAPDQFFEYDFH